MKTFLIRLSSGLVVAALAITAMLYNQYTFFVLMSIILLGSLNEYFNLTDAKRDNAKSFFQGKWFVMLLSFIAFAEAFVLASPPAQGVPDFNNYFLLFKDVLLGLRDPALTLTATVPSLFFILFIVELFSKSEKPFENLGSKAIALLWILVPVILAVNIYFEKGGAFILAMFFIIWVYDSFCYITGSFIGKRKLFERISPKKTWEGMLGGIVVTLAFVFFVDKIPPLFNWVSTTLITSIFLQKVSNFLPVIHLNFTFWDETVSRWSQLSKLEWMILAFVIMIAATFGDLIESLLKRSLGIKDSGNIMPGHGGFLDRLDSFYLVMPFVAMTLWMFTQVKNLILVFEYLSQ